MDRGALWVSVHGVTELDTTERLSMPLGVEPGGMWFVHSSCYLGEGNGTPLQYSCLENPMDGGAW